MVSFFFRVRRWTKGTRCLSRIRRRHNKSKKGKLIILWSYKTVKNNNRNYCVITNNNNTNNNFSQYLELWLISETDKAVLKKSWDIIVKDMERIGVVMFLKMFETHPETLSSFIHDVYSIRELEMDEW